VSDDVLGLVVLAAAQGIIASMNASETRARAQFGVADLAIILGKAIGFLAVSLLLGQFTL
jgi:hypothetical protein